MGILSQIESLLTKAKPEEPTTLARPRIAKGYMYGMEELDRTSVIRDCRKMFDEDIRIHQNLWRVASDMVSGNFGVHVKEGPYKKRVEDIANDALINLGLMTNTGRAGLDLISYITYVMRDGDLFLQLGMNDNGVAEILKMPLMSTDIDGYLSYSKTAFPVFFRNSNVMDKFDNPAKAYYLSQSSLPMTNIATNPNVQWFRDWQIIHARWQHEKPRKYGTPLLSAGRITYKMLREGETDIAIRRKTRAGQKRQHKIKGATTTTIDQYKEWNQDSLSDIAAAAADFFTNENTEINVLQGDEQIGIIDDIQHHLDTLGVGMIVPLSMTGYGKQVSRDILEFQNVEYRRLLEVFGLFPIEAIVKPVVEMNWLLNGIFPGNYDWAVEWSSKEPWKLTADGLFKMFGLVSPPYWAIMASKVLPDFNIEKELPYIQKAYIDLTKKVSSDSTKRADQDEGARTAIA